MQRPLNEQVYTTPDELVGGGKSYEAECTHRQTTIYCPIKRESMYMKQRKQAKKKVQLFVVEFALNRMESFTLPWIPCRGLVQEKGST